VDVPLLVASGVFVVGAFVHSVPGETMLLRPVLKLDLPEFLGTSWMAARTLRMAWHLTSVAWLGFAGILAALAMPATDLATAVPWIIAGTCVVMAALSLVVTRGRHVFSWVGSVLVVAAILWSQFG